MICPYNPAGTDHSTWRQLPDPRYASCSYCGSLNPEDVLRLLYEGAEDEIADGQNKGYLHPKGWTAAVRKQLKSNLMPLAAMQQFPTPKWPFAKMLKFRVGHFSPAQFEELQKIRNKENHYE